MASTSESPTDLPYETIVLPAPITYEDFTWTPVAHPPRILIGKKLKQLSTATVHPPYIGAQTLLRASPEWVDRHRLIYGWAVDIGALQKRGEIEGYSVDEIGKANVLQRFRMIMRDVCGLRSQDDFLPVLLSDGSHAMCVVLAQNLTKETMAVDQEKAQKVMMLLATSTYPRWYRYAWDIDHS
ncbi:uncharacterized protein STEHIDRAFT_154540 [Stereum hirsutum FP-91666 SS1]|uniref:uncharacterized protein n=1 Tax=Stereum hirsutum (strain FP-91666) TaxID=721885 RepID=UPI000440F697|nr:uncharacterized protein STEHIDRAFT_154540 [Stereum hirsutum FP-91666 SS1]EIM88822.1 hypothetical protein STEHIDRAFT_154540 [Stereum hirsutum FP-91666 SS1]